MTPHAFPSATAIGPAPASAAIPSGWTAAVLQRIRAATSTLNARLAAAPPERLLSLCLALPAVPTEVAGQLGGDTRWCAPHGALRFNALDTAARFTGAQAVAESRHARHDWVHWGEAAVAPLMLFTAPPATEPTQPSVRLPRALLRQGPDGTHLILSARRGHATAAQLVDGWLDATGRLLAPAPADARWSRITTQHATPDADTWRARVDGARQAIRAGRLDKVVLARRLQATLSAPVDVGAALRRLERMYPGCHVLSLPHAGGQLLAATPEPLALKRGDSLVAHALAGTARRSGDAQADARAVTALLASAKERREHALVVEALRTRLAGLCHRLEAAGDPAVLPLRFVQHLWTPVRGRLRAGVDLFDAVLALHPTPAVLGLPDTAARAWLAACGEQRDCLYTGVAGWTDRNGDGEAVVLLRSAWLAGTTAVLWAGAGIMADSDPDAELAETELKLKTMLEILSSAP